MGLYLREKKIWIFPQKIIKIFIGFQLFFYYFSPLLLFFFLQRIRLIFFPSGAWKNNLKKIKFLEQLFNSLWFLFNFIFLKVIEPKPSLQNTRRKKKIKNKIKPQMSLKRKKIKIKIKLELLKVFTFGNNQWVEIWIFGLEGSPALWLLADSGK